MRKFLLSFSTRCAIKPFQSNNLQGLNAPLRNLFVPGSAGVMACVHFNFNDGKFYGPFKEDDF
ncbi:uncharacterized protein METZ01_LOCUS445133 [marine metagenome]|uniref:Uncharacterized protein n=1 Tax=marine metagenome TaxID=408172 RepID=A0A382ZAQ0_9ZZZZ